MTVEKSRMGGSKELSAAVEAIRQRLDEKNEARDLALKRTRRIIRHCSLVIRAIHRGEGSTVEAELAKARALVEEVRESLAPFPDLYYAGYTQDALKEFAEANLFRAMVDGDPIPSPEELSVEDAPYLGGLGEAAGELRRYVLDELRREDYGRAEAMLATMDEIYGLLVTVDYPDAITGRLRRITDVVRGVTERTRGDLTTSLQLYQLRKALERAERG